MNVTPTLPIILALPLGLLAIAIFFCDAGSPVLHGTVHTVIHFGLWHQSREGPRPIVGLGLKRGAISYILLFVVGFLLGVI
jgi:hypothetical protein